LPNHFIDRELEPFDIAVHDNARLRVQRVIERTWIGEEQLIVAKLLNRSGTE
jgi:hypothetical protein